MLRMQLWAPGDAELISCYRRHGRWGVWVAVLVHLQPSRCNGHARALCKATQYMVTQGCTSLNSKVGIVGKFISIMSSDAEQK